ncbi:type-F conjugative transfer system secretin TraK [Escherichia coli]|nr:type-F conjugative transfer system secretin TraK [Escherichia coli]
MRKNNTAIIFGSLFFSCSVMAANGTLAPTVVPMVNGGQASIAISNTSPNLFTVPGDRIIAVNSLDGALTNNEQTASGGVVVATVNKKPFTFILETERGLNLSIQAVPREGAGRTIQLVSDLRGTGEEAGAWETSTPYESLLVTISQAVRGGKLPAGWYQVPVTKETLQAPAGLSSVADAVWTGNHLKMVRFAVENKTLSALNIRESDFWQPGTRAVMFSQLAFADGEVLVTGEMNELEKASFLSTLNKMAEKKKNTGKEMFVGVTRVLSDNESKVFFEKVKGQYPEMDIKIPFLTVMETLQYKPAESAAKVQCPVLVVIAGQDSVNPPEQGRALYDAVASGTKELYEEADACHYDIYKGAFFERVAAVQTQWFKKHL